MNNKIRIELSFDEFKTLLTILDSNQDPDLEPLKRIFQDKLTKMVEHELYTKYKTARSEKEREIARQRYLDSKGIPDRFRW